MNMQNEKIHKRGRYTAEFKEKVALEALSGTKTHAQIASETLPPVLFMLISIGV